MFCISYNAFQVDHGETGVDNPAMSLVVEKGLTTKPDNA